jgi:CHASE3 domain sensor protein
MNEITLSDLTTAMSSLTRDIEELENLHSASPEIHDILTSRKRQLDTLLRVCDAFKHREKTKPPKLSR